MEPEAVLTAITAVAAAVSSLTAFVTIRDARQERRDTAFADLVQARRVALSELGEALLQLGEAIESGTVRRHAYQLAQARARHALMHSLHPHIEYARISHAIEKPAEENTLDDIQDALEAVFESSESVPDAYRG